jgi:hypothetical protein
MEYKVIVVGAAGLAGTNFERAAERLGALVNEAVVQGWKPQGGVAVGESQMTREPYLLQAVVKGG